MRTRLLQAFLLLCLVSATVAVLFPGHRSRHDARRLSCQSNLKQIGLALQQYAQDYDDRLPPHQWAVRGVQFLSYLKTDALFQCPETTAAKGTNDYFFNSHFLGAPREKIASPKALILFGDGRENAPFDATLAQFPSAWLEDENSPAWRHLGRANYGFGDGHVKWLKATSVNRDFRIVKP
ncbi:hypothetical protein IAD21_03408 [Abditibacteriota bacterium]|nr:hypothetical protein IAD21_03408 [Abditibacteriota bacterium]